MTYKTKATIKESNQLVLRDLPFRPGQQVDVLLVSEEDRAARVAALRSLLAQTQALPSVQAVTEEDIAAEIAAYRAQRP